MRSNKSALISKFKAHTLHDSDMWSSSTGPGIKFEELLKLPIYDEKQTLPVNIKRSNGQFVLNETETNWDLYFEAIQRNRQVGYVSKYNKGSRRPKKGFLNASGSDSFKNPNFPSESGKTQSFYDNTLIEWDEKVEPKSKSKPKFTLKEISKTEKDAIIKEIENETGGSPTQASSMPFQGK